LKRWATAVEIDGTRCLGIDNEGRHGANFHAWENDLHVGFGIAHYATKWGDQDLFRTARGILQLSLAAPEKSGAFPCIYNFRERKWEGSLFWTARAADPPKEPLRVRGWDDLEAELGRVFPEPKFSPFLSLFFATYEYSLRVSFLRAQ
jgi:hypothetical protein